MTHDPASLKDDIAFMRAMAHEGRNAPLLNGSVLVAAALIFGPANIAQWAIQSGVLVVDPMVQLWVWLAAGAVFALAWTLLIRRISRKPGYGSPANKAVNAAWSGLGFGIFVMWLSLMAIGFTSDNWTMMWAMPSVVATAYGSAWIVSGTMSGQRWMTGIGLLAYAGAVACGATIGNTAVYLVFAVIMVATALIPGLILMRQEPAEVV